MYKREVPRFDPTQAFAPVASSESNPFDRKDHPMRERVAALFLSRPHEWIDGREIQLVGGQYAWRTRVSDCRTQLHMVIDNRQRKERGVTVSEYRYVPSDDEFCLTREADGPTRRQG